MANDSGACKQFRALYESLPCPNGLRGKPPQTKADRIRLQSLLYQFRRAAIAIKQIATDRLIVMVGGNEIRQLLQETASLLEQLAQELTRRIGETSVEATMPDSERES
nr:hypothetical protein [Armatimonas sp.]